MKWWDDLFALNEGFATWTTHKIVDQYKPAFGEKIDAAASATYIMDEDGPASARDSPARRERRIARWKASTVSIRTKKAPRLLRMVEHAVGEDTFLQKACTII